MYFQTALYVFTLQPKALMLFVNFIFVLILVSRAKWANTAAQC